jgi:ribonuclease HII
VKRPTFRLERAYFAEGLSTVAGIDEVGRGAWAGPISVGVFVLDAAKLKRFPPGVRDSKLLTAAAREALFGPLSKVAAAFGVGHASNEECDSLGMSEAQRLAARRAFEQLDVAPEACIVDGRWNFSPQPAARTLVDADASCFAVAAASVLAKVTRDRMMAELAPFHPAYRFERNKGYPSPEHRAAIARFGLTSLHRASWAFARPAGECDHEDGAGGDELELDIPAPNCDVAFDARL